MNVQRIHTKTISQNDMVFYSWRTKIPYPKRHKRVKSVLIIYL